VRVLVVDDNLLSCTRLLSQLQAAGWQAAAVGFGPEGLTQARQRRPDVVVVNLAAHASDATLFVRALKAEPDLAAIPVLGFCGHRETRRREAALAAGCDRVVSNSSVSAGLPALITTLVAGSARVHRGA
jgi:two-component system cell cycle response regulator DivK